MVYVTYATQAHSTNSIIIKHDRNSTNSAGSSPSMSPLVETSFGDLVAEGGPTVINFA